MKFSHGLSRASLRVLRLGLSFAALAALGACASDKGSSGYVPPEKLYGPYGSRDIEDTIATPPHNMPRNEYPFDSRGNYIRGWTR